MIMEETHFLLESELPCVQAHDTNNHSAEVLDQSIHLLVRSRSPIVKLSLSKDCYTYLLKCLDLNINYTDNFESHFNFRQVSLPPIPGGIKFVSDSYLSVFSFELLNVDRSLISELLILDFDMKWTNYNDNNKDIFIGASSLFALHNESSSPGREKDVLIGPVNSKDTVESDYSFYEQSDFKTCSIDIKITPQYEKHWKVKILQHKSVIKVYVLMLLSDFLIEGFPDYSKEIEKPNEYIEDPEKYPQSSYILDLKEAELILPSEESEFRILLQGDLNLVLRMKSIAHIKEQLFEANPRELKLESYFLGVALQDMQFLVRNTTFSSLDSKRPRILIRKFNLNFRTSEAMLIHNELFKIEGETLLGLDPLFITLSYQDILSITRSCIYNISRIDADYFKREKFQKNVQDLNVSQIMEENKEVSQLMEENKDEFFPELDKKVSDDFNFLKLPLERGKSEYFPASPRASNLKENPNLFDTLNIFMEEFARMKERASKKLAQFQQHVTKYMKSSKRDLIASQTLRRSSEFSEESRGKALFNLSESFVRKESMKSSGRPSISSQHSNPSYTDSLEISKEKYERLNDTFQIDCRSIKLLFINDINNVFYPVVSLNLLNPQYCKATNNTEISVKLKSLYYNPSSSFWEPLFEKINIEAKQISGENIMNISINKPIQFNFTEALVNVVLTTYKSWRENTTMFNESSDLFSRDCMKQYVRHSRAASGSAEVVLEQGVCPYYIKNDTGMDIYYKECRAGSEKIKIKQNEILDILEHYEEVIENLVKEASHSLKFSEKIIEISFADPNFAPISHLTLSTAHPVIHRLSSLPYHHLIYSINMTNISKQITLRSPFKIKNKTKYAFTLLFIDSAESHFEFTINSRESLNIPVSLIESEMQLCWKSSSSEKWKIPALLKHFRKKEYLDVVVEEINVVMAREGKASSWMVDIVLVPPFVFMNILPYPIEIKTLESDAQNILLTGEEMKFYRIPSVEVLTFELKVPRFSPCEVRFDPFSPLKQQKVEFSGLTLYIGLVRNESARHCYSIYARSIIINNADPSLKYYEDNKLIAGQPARCLMISKFKRIRIGFDEETRSNEISFNDPTSVLDVKIIRQKETKEGRREEYEYRILNSLSLANRDKHVYTRVFTIVPRYVIHNLTPCSLHLAQEDALNPLCSVLAKPQTPTQFHWRSPMRSGRISILYLEKKNNEEYLFLPEAENANQWDWSSSFGLNEEEVLDVPCLHRIKSHFRLHLNVRKVIVEGTMIIEIRLQTEATPVYQIVNQSKYFSILFWQEKNELVTNYMKPLSSASYGFADIHSDPILCVKFFLTNNENPIPLCLDHAVHQFDLARMNQEIKLYFKYTRKIGYCLFVSTENNGRTKTLKIQASTKFSDSDSVGSNASQKYSLNIKELGISLIHTHENQRSELAYISLQGLKAEMESRSKFTDVKLSIENMQIDNMFSLRVPYPIILQSTELKKTPALLRNSFLQLSVRIKPQPTMYYLEDVKCSLAKIDLKLDDEILSFFIKFSEYILKEMQTIVTNYHDVFFNQSHYQIALTVEGNENPENYVSVSNSPWNRILDSNLITDQDVFIERLRISKVEISFSFLLKLESKGDFLRESGVVIKAIGVAITNVEASTINLPALEMKNQFGPMLDHVGKLVEYYRGFVATTAFKLIVSSDFIGNPVNNLYFIAKGVKDFVVLPVHGYRSENKWKGMALGFAQGSWSLLKNTTIGIFGMFSKITSSWSKALLALSNDKEFMSDREARFIKEKVDTVVEGIGYGVTSCLYSSIAAVKGLGSQPYSGLKKRGMRGAVVGLVHSLTGLALKPISGVLDLFSRTGEGIKNTAMIFDVSVEERRRSPRAFYSTLQLMKKYDPIDAEVLVHLENIEYGRYKKDHMLSSSIFFVEGDVFLLFIAEEHVVLILAREQEVRWRVQTKNIAKVIQEVFGIFLELKNSHEDEVEIPISASPLSNEIYFKLRQALQYKKSHK